MSNIDLQLLDRHHIFPGIVKIYCKVKFNSKYLGRGGATSLSLSNSPFLNNRKKQGEHRVSSNYKYGVK